LVNTKPRPVPPAGKAVPEGMSQSSVVSSASAKTVTSVNAA
jgi:hypothetical protein